VTDAQVSGSGPGLASSARFLSPLLAVFAASGCSALVYEIVWFQLLELVIGSTAVSLAVLLGTYMGGMGLGSLVLPRLIPSRLHPLRIFSWLELGIGASGLAVVFAMPAFVRFYTAHAGYGATAILWRGAVSAVCLLPPTILMGATLPVLARWVEMTPQGVSWLGFLYSWNTVGSVFGCLAAGFYLLRVYDITTATFVAVVINTTVASLGFIWAMKTPPLPPIEKQKNDRPAGRAVSWPVHVTIGVSGFCALGAEVIWTRLLSLSLGATVYTFSIILAVFLAGLGIGSGAGARLSRTGFRPRLALGSCQVLLTGGIAWSAFMVAKVLPYWAINPSLDRSAWANFLFALLRCFCSILPAAILWGASFPLALAAVSRREDDPGRTVGNVYAANTVGSILGAVGFSLVLIPAWGTQQSQRLLVGLSAAGGLLALAPLLGTLRAGARKLKVERLIAGAAAVELAIFLAWLVPRVPWESIAFGRYLPTRVEKGRVLYVGEGMNASVAVSELNDGTRNFHISGRIEASSNSQDMRVQRMLGHFPALVHSGPKTVLVVGCGAGVTAGTFVLYPGVRRIVICEIEPLIPRIVARYFAPENYGVLDDPRVEVVTDDARHYILTTREKFDIITTDPIHPWIKGSAALYTKEYLELCERHLNPGGVMAQWVPFYESTLETVKSEIATFFGTVPNGTIWSNDLAGQGYDVVLMGLPERGSIDLDDLQRRLDRDDHQAVARSLEEIGFRSAVEIVATFAGRSADLRPWLKNAQINRDRNLRLQYLAGLGLNSSDGDYIYNDLIGHYKFPNSLFIGSPEILSALKKALGKGS